MFYKQIKYPPNPNIKTPKGTIYVMQNYPYITTKDGLYSVNLEDNKDCFSSEPLLFIGENYHRQTSEGLRRKGFKPINGYFIVTKEDSVAHGISVGVGKRKKSLDLLLSSVCKYFNVRKYDILGSDTSEMPSKARALFAFVSYYGADATFSAIGKRINRTHAGVRKMISTIIIRYKDSLLEDGSLAKEYEDFLIEFGIDIAPIAFKDYEEALFYGKKLNKKLWD